METQYRKDADHAHTAAGTGETAFVVFDYDPTRSGEVPRRLLEGCQGYLQADAYAGYHRAITELGLTSVLCMAHARRHFVDAIKALGLNPNKPPAKPPDEARRLLTALGYFRHLYAIERRLRARPMSVTPLAKRKRCPWSSASTRGCARPGPRCRPRAGSARRSAPS